MNTRSQQINSTQKSDNFHCFINLLAMFLRINFKRQRFHNVEVTYASEK